MGCVSSINSSLDEMPDVTDIERLESISIDGSEDGVESKSNINKYMKKLIRNEAKIRKILLLGSGACGKSTLFKTLRIIHKTGIEETEYIEAKSIIRSNCIMSLLTLLKKSAILYESDKDKHSDCYIDLDENALTFEHIKTMVEYVIPNAVPKSVEELTDEDVAILYESMSYLWSLPQVQNTFNKRQYFSFITNIDYFFDKLHVVFDRDYKPSSEDVIKCRIRTTGIIEEQYMINDRQFHIFDTGGERNERKKWPSLFDAVYGIVFVASLTSSNEVLFEDELTNSMLETVRLWKEVIHIRYFKKTKLFLIFNKNDLFRQLLKMKGAKIGEYLKNVLDADSLFMGKVANNNNDVDVIFNSFYSEAYSGNAFYSKYTLLTHGYVHSLEHDYKYISKDLMQLIDLYTDTYFEVFYDKCLEYIKDMFLQCAHGLNKEIKVYVVSVVNQQECQDIMDDIIQECAKPLMIVK